MSQFDFGGTIITVAVVNLWPWFEAKNISGVLTPGDGVDVNILKILADKLNFR